MKLNEKLIEVLTDLVETNTCRVTGYENAAEEAKDLDADLRTIFRNMANDSRRFIAELTDEIQKLGGKLQKNNSGKGRIYQVWMDIKAGFLGHDRQAILESCELNEDSVQKAYNAAFASDAEIDSKTLSMITSQKSYLKTAHKVIKTYRDAHWKMTA